jgi:uncharacterized membrane protein
MPGKIDYNLIAGRKIGRIEAISDGVFAVAMTLLVLDIRIPDPGPVHSELGLFRAFCVLTPRFLTYFLSFMTLGIFWTGQAAQFNYIDRSDRDLSWISLFFLLCVSILPFTTALLSAFIQFRLAVGIYWLNIFLLGLMLYIHWSYAYRHHCLELPKGMEAAIDKAMRRRIVIAQTLYAGGALLCFINTYLSIGVIILIQLNYALAFFFRRDGRNLRSS